MPLQALQNQWHRQTTGRTVLVDAVRVAGELYDEAHFQPPRAGHADARLGRRSLLAVLASELLVLDHLQVRYMFAGHRDNLLMDASHCKNQPAKRPPAACVNRSQ